MEQPPSNDLLLSPEVLDECITYAREAEKDLGGVEGELALASGEQGEHGSSTSREAKGSESTVPAGGAEGVEGAVVKALAPASQPAQQWMVRTINIQVWCHLSNLCVSLSLSVFVL